jgi:hypothetical protein
MDLIAVLIFGLILPSLHVPMYLFINSSAYVFRSHILFFFVSVAIVFFSISIFMSFIYHYLFSLPLCLVRSCMSLAHFVFNLNHSIRLYDYVWVCGTGRPNRAAHKSTNRNDPKSIRNLINGDIKEHSDLVLPWFDDRDTKLCQIKKHFKTWW